MSRANFVQVQLAAAATDIQTTLSVKAPIGGLKLPPADGGRLVLTDSPGRPLAFEIITYTGYTGTGPYTLTGVVRGVEGTVGLGWAIDTFVIQSLTVAELDSLLAVKADNAVVITAGNGLSGGGALTASRTLTLGTPATVTSATTNAVTATSHTHALTVTKADVLLPAVDNTSDLAKPVSTAQQAALNLKLDATANAVSATKLATARTIGGVAFDGTAAITLPGVNAAGNQSTTGNAATATVLQTARTINSVSFNGSANITVADATKLPLAGGTATGAINAPTFNATLAAGGGFQGIDADTALAPSFTWTSDQDTGIYRPVSDVIGFAAGGIERGRVNIVGFSGNGSQLTALDAANISTGLIDAARVPSLNQSTTGNAATATTLQTARTINGVSFNGSANVTVADATKLPTAGGTMTGAIGFAAGQTWPTFDQSTTGNAATATTLTGLTSTVAQLNFVAGVTSAIQTQMNTKAPLNAPAFTGVPTAMTAVVGTNTTQIASTAFAVAEIGSRAPTKTGVGASGSWPIAVTGNAASATVLQTARTINGVSFNGSANITVADATKLPHTGGTMSNTLRVSIPNSTTTTYQNGQIEVLASGAFDASIGFHRAGFTACQLRHAGNGLLLSGTSQTAPADLYVYGNITGVEGFYGSLYGNAATAATLQTPRSINGVSFDGSANITVADNTKLSLGGGTLTGGLISTSGSIIRGDEGGSIRGYLWGDVNGFGFLGSGGGWAARVPIGTGDWLVTGNVTSLSDIRSKCDIEVIPGALSKVLELSGYTYNRVDAEGGRRETGVVAQEVLKVLPEAVLGGPTTEDPEAKYSVAYGNMVGLLIEAIKELKAEVDELKAGAL
jgi:hypothetical protein